MNARSSLTLLSCLAAPLLLLSGACTEPRDLEEQVAQGAPTSRAIPTGEGGAPSAAPQIPPAPPADGPIYVHGPYSLYKFEPIKAALTPIGDFDCLLGDPSGTADSGMHDLAVDSSGRIFGVAKVRGTDAEIFTANVIVSVDKETGSCKKELTIDSRLLDPRGGLELRGLSFVPRGTLSASEEALVALEIYGAYIQIDLKNQRALRIGALGDGASAWKTKGADIVSILGADTYATVQGPMLDERLVALDPKTGQVRADIGSLGNTIFGGLAYWGGTLYGFTVAGRIFSVDPTSARTAEIPIKAPAGTRFDGAGVTITAPIFPPG